MSKICPHCSKDLQDDMMFCPYCGKSIEESHEPSPIDRAVTADHQAESVVDHAPISDTHKGRRLGVVIACTVIAVIGIGIGVFFGTAKMRAYSAAEKLLETHSYQEAIDQFSMLGDYKDSAVRVQEAAYLYAGTYYDAGEYETAKSMYEGLGTYSDSEDRAKDSEYQYAMTFFDAKDYNKAKEIFQSLGDYSDAADKTLECQYQQALIAYDEGHLDDAITQFSAIESYKDSGEILKGYKYEKANNLFETEDYAGAEVIFLNLGEYENAPALAEQSAYLQTVDGQFLKALKEGLMARWEYIDLFESGKTDDHYSSDGEYYSRLVDFEYEKVSPFKEQEFNDTRLGEMAVNYVAVLDNCYTALEYFTVNYTAYSEMWDSARAERTHLLAELVSDYGLTVDPPYESDLSGLVSDSDIYYEQEKLKADVQVMYDGATLNYDPYVDDWSGETLWYDYSLTLTNTTGTAFEYLYADIQALDSDGNIVMQGSCSQITSFQPGQTATVDVYFNDMYFNPYHYTLQYVPHYSTGTIFE